MYPGSGGCVQTAGIKIQLEYDLHSGQFLNFQVGPGKNNDKTFGTECLDTLRPGDMYMNCDFSCSALISLSPSNKTQYSVNNNQNPMHIRSNYENSKIHSPYNWMDRIIINVVFNIFF